MFTSCCSDTFKSFWSSSSINRSYRVDFVNASIVYYLLAGASRDEGTVFSPDICSVEVPAAK